MVALGQTYFAVQTRKQEIEEEMEQLIEDERRLMLRNEMKKHNSNLATPIPGVLLCKDRCC